MTLLRQTAGRNRPRSQESVEFYRYILVDMSPGGRTAGDGWHGENIRPTSHASRGGRLTFARGVARALGWGSLAFGLAELVAPERIARLGGIRDDERNQLVLRLLGLREIVSGLGILQSGGRSGWLWMRVAGDITDLALLSSALQGETTRSSVLDRATRLIRREAQMEPMRGTAALAAILGTMALDVWCAVRLRHNGRATERGLGQRRVEIKRAITVNRPAGELYALWRHLDNLPRFMRHVHSVEMLGDGRSHWMLKEPGGTTFEWDAEIIADRPGELIAWRSLPGASVANAGSVRFVPAPRHQGTEVHVDLRYEPPLGKLGQIAAKLAMIFGEAPAEQVAEDLRRFKQVVETGEVARSDASIWGIALTQHPAQPSKKVPAEMAHR